MQELLVILIISIPKFWSDNNIHKSTWEGYWFQECSLARDCWIIAKILEIKARLATIAANIAANSIEWIRNYHTYGVCDDTNIVLPCAGYDHDLKNSHSFCNHLCSNDHWYSWACVSKLGPLQIQWRRLPCTSFRYIPNVYLVCMELCIKRSTMLS